MPFRRLASLCLVATASAQELSGPGALGRAIVCRALRPLTPRATTFSRARGVGRDARALGWMSVPCVDAARCGVDV